MPTKKKTTTAARPTRAKLVAAAEQHGIKNPEAAPEVLTALAIHELTSVLDRFLALAEKIIEDERQEARWMRHPLPEMDE